jgi:hypothetical protein
MSFSLNDLQQHSAPQIGHHESIPWRSVTGKMPLVTKTNFLIGGFCTSIAGAQEAFFD